MTDVLDPGVLDRATGMLIAQACGDALGVPYGFARRLAPGEDATMSGGGLGPYARGEWSDDTQVAVCVARVSSNQDIDPASPDGSGALDEIASALEAWKVEGASDMSRQTAAVLRRAARLTGAPAARLREASRALSLLPELTAGNGALMRTGVVGLCTLDDRRATARIARAVAELTHADLLAGDSCVLWSEAVRLAVTSQQLDLEAGLDLIPAARRLDWQDWIADAANPEPRAGLRANAFTVTALQAAWHAIATTGPTTTSGAPTIDAGNDPAPSGREHLVAGIQAAIRIGGETDTVAALAGSLLGAKYGAEAIPRQWQEPLHGWPGITARELGVLARRTVQRAAATDRIVMVALNGAPDGEGASEICPVCKTLLPADPIYSGRVCRWCVDWVTDEFGRPVTFGEPGAIRSARYADGSPASPDVLAGHAWICGREFQARSTRDGVVVQSLIVR